MVSRALKKTKAVDRPAKTVKGKTKSKRYDEIYLWDIFSLYIRFRDTDENGFGQCFTCDKPMHWKQLQAGHGIGREAMGTKYCETNNHAQGVCCNKYKAGNQAIYKDRVEEKYGAGTWEKMYIASKRVTKLTRFEWDLLTDRYYGQVLILAKEKGIDPMTLAPMKKWKQTKK